MQDTNSTTGIEPKALFKLSYGLFAVTAQDAGRDNGCITNTAIQVASAPDKIALAVNKANLTHDMILSSGKLNVSVLTEDTPFELFKHFGLQSGRSVDKFAGYPDVQRSANGLIYLSKTANAMFSGAVEQAVDCGSHTLFIAGITQSMVLSQKPSVTYAYYFEHIKPRPQPAQEKKKRWVCTICGYVHEGDVLPPDFVCPLCNHGAEYFELM